MMWLKKQIREVRLGTNRALLDFLTVASYRNFSWSARLRSGYCGEDVVRGRWWPDWKYCG
jgi:hypothetical protein